MEKGPRVVSHLPEAHQSWVPGYPWATEHPESLLSWLWEQEEWESRKETGGRVSQEFQSGARGGTAGPVREDSWASWNWLWEWKTSNRMFKAALLFKGGTLREAIGHQAQVTSLGNSGSCIPSQFQGQAAIHACRGGVERAILGEQWVLMPNRVCWSLKYKNPSRNVHGRVT